MTRLADSVTFSNPDPGLPTLPVSCLITRYLNLAWTPTILLPTVHADPFQVYDPACLTLLTTPATLLTCTCCLHPLLCNLHHLLPILQFQLPLQLHQIWHPYFTVLRDLCPHSSGL